MPRIDNSLIGAAGVHFVVSELSLRGLIALPTIRNTPGVDIVVVSANGTRHDNLQAKTSGRKVGFWPINKHYEQWVGEHRWYVFLRYIKRESRFEVFLESADRVAEQAAQNAARDRERGNVEWHPCWVLPRDEAELGRVRRQWAEFGTGQPAG